MYHRERKVLLNCVGFVRAAHAWDSTKRLLGIDYYVGLLEFCGECGENLNEALVLRGN